MKLINFINKVVLKSIIKTIEPNISQCSFYYTNGEHRPYLRGVLHMIIALFIPIIIMIISIKYREEWPLVIFLLGKEASYLSSFIFHRWAGISSSIIIHKFSRQCDRFCILISIIATGIPTSFSSPIFYYGVSCIILILSGITNFMDTEIQNSVGENQMCRKLFRMCMIFQLLFSIFFIGLESTLTWSCYWIFGTIAYVCGFLVMATKIFVKCDNKIINKTEYSSWNKYKQNILNNEDIENKTEYFPWHKYERNGLHEDFHLCIFIGDVLYFINAIYYSNRNF